MDLCHHLQEVDAAESLDGLLEGILDKDALIEELKGEIAALHRDRASLEKLVRTIASDLQTRDQHIARLEATLHTEVLSERLSELRPSESMAVRDEHLAELPERVVTSPVAGVDVSVGAGLTTPLAARKLRQQQHLAELDTMVAELQVLRDEVGELWHSPMRDTSCVSEPRAVVEAMALAIEERDRKLAELETALRVKGECLAAAERRVAELGEMVERNAHIKEERDRKLRELETALCVEAARRRSAEQRTSELELAAEVEASTRGLNDDAKLANGTCTHQCETHPASGHRLRSGTGGHTSALEPILPFASVVSYTSLGADPTALASTRSSNMEQSTVLSRTASTLPVVKEAPRAQDIDLVRSTSAVQLTSELRTVVIGGHTAVGDETLANCDARNVFLQRRVPVTVTTPPRPQRSLSLPPTLKRPNAALSPAHLQQQMPTGQLINAWPVMPSADTPLSVGSDRICSGDTRRATAEPARCGVATANITNGQQSLMLTRSAKRYPIAAASGVKGHQGVDVPRIGRKYRPDSLLDLARALAEGSR